MSVQVEHYAPDAPPGRRKIKSWLSRARWLDKEINAKLAQIANLRDMLRRCTSNVSTGSGGRGGDWTETLARIAVLEGQINDDIDRLIDSMTEIRKAIGQLPTDEMRLLIELRYLNGYGWNKIAQQMNCSRPTVCRMRDRALDFLREAKVETP